MKRCPACQRAFVDDSLLYCLEDGTALLSEGPGSSDMAATVIMPDPRMTVPERLETQRPAQITPHPLHGQPHAWPPPAQTPAPPGAFPARSGKGVALTSLLLAIAAFVLLGFCIIAGASGVEEQLIGGVFLFSVLLALAGAVLGIIATSKSSKDTSAQNARSMSLVALILNGLYLLITVVFLILGAVASSR
jgi:hypothetical protein